ncbi:MAG: Gfo/Idh/MocA family oxidoreductase [Clostridia bacterium]|nr:Gfo/Idh/MocA family oxidoreductase [Clostridia bacterium]
MKNTIKAGIIGLGGRGIGLLKQLVKMKDVEINAVCDLYEDRVKEGSDMVFKAKKVRPYETLDYTEILKMENVDTVFIFSSWESHIKAAIQAMEAGKAVGLEVGGAYCVEDCWALVDAYERTKTPIMMLENCCYGKYELMVLNMVRQGLFGDIVHCSGGYLHDLRDEITHGKENRHYRLNNYINRNCENYPTHELGPIAKVLNINRGNLMVSLTSTSSCAKGLKQYIADGKATNPELKDVEFKQGDIVTTVIKCINGETIVLTLDTTLPRAYSRGFTVRGTKAMYQEDNNMVFEDSKHHRLHFAGKVLWNNAKRYHHKYAHPIWRWYKKEGVRGGHGGMDYLVLRAFIEALKQGTHTPIDVYDTASWMVITPLSEQSIKEGSKPMAIPDFTRGKYLNRTDKADGRFNID